jgi:pimeloyl-ACP methyl ester carboxylesterase
VFAGKSIGQIADHFETIIRGLNRKPAIIGHSTGGLLTQILAGRGLAAVSVAIDPAPFRGVLPLPISALKSSSPVLRNPANRDRAVPLTYDQFRYSFANAVGEEEAKQLYEDFAVPIAGKPLFQAAAANLNPWTEAKVDTKKPRPWVAAAHLRRAVPHRPVCDLQRLLQAPARQPRRDRDREDPRRGARAHHRQRLASRGRHRARVRAALHLVFWCGSLPDVDIPFDRRREQECQAQRPLWGQVQVSPASVVAKLNAVVGVALEAADDDDAISLTVLRTLVYQHGAKLRVALSHVLYLCASRGLGAR